MKAHEVVKETSFFGPKEVAIVKLVALLLSLFSVATGGHERRYIREVDRRHRIERIASDIANDAKFGREFGFRGSHLEVNGFVFLFRR